MWSMDVDRVRGNARVALKAGLKYDASTRISTSASISHV